MPTIHDNSKEAVQAFILHIETAYYRWYERSVRRNYYFWLCCQTLGLVAGFGTAVFAALLKEQLVSGSWISWLVVALPFLGSTASTVSVQSRVYDRWRLRESGRIGFQSLVTEGRRRFASALSPAEYTQLHKDLSDATDKIEKVQSMKFFALAPSLTPPQD